MADLRLLPDPRSAPGDCLSDWNRRGFGNLNMVEAFAISSDTFFYQMAVHLGVDRLAKWAHELGFDHQPGSTCRTKPAG